MERDEPNYQVEEDRLIEGEPLVTIPIPLKDICPEREDIAVANIIEWAEDRGLLNKDVQPTMQMLKLVEEVGETAKAIAYKDKPNIIDGLGDCFVCLIVLCKQLGFNPGYTMNEVYKVISKRTGKLEDGLFKKDG
jgi:NTP pyrophosphatase (non-canonical NTP hydrolase)